MSACEACWAEASRRAFMLGGSVPDRYREVLAERPECRIGLPETGDENQ